LNPVTGQPLGYTKILDIEDMDEAQQSTYLSRLQELHEIMEPFYVRHLKLEQCCEHHPEGVMPWLPQKTYEKIWVDLNPTQRRIYEQMRKEMVAWVGEHQDSPLVASVVVAQLTRLSQIALATPRLDIESHRHRDKVNGGWLINDMSGDEWFEEQVVNLEMPSEKINVVKDLLKDNSNKQFVVYSSSKKCCYLAQAEWEDVGISTRVISGDSSEWDNNNFTRQFARGDFQVCIGVIEAIAEGIDGLQHATDTGIFLDRSWKTIKNVQAEDRLHRDGADGSKPVYIIDVMARNTLDLGRKTKIDRKWEGIKRMLGDPIATQQQAVSDYSGEVDINDAIS
jgi:SNF2 family DNA or RNA helicase